MRGGESIGGSRWENRQRKMVDGEEGEYSTDETEEQGKTGIKPTRPSGKARGNARKSISKH